jgi:hypothetical protein
VGDTESSSDNLQKKSLGRQAYKEGVTVMDCKERVWGCGQDSSCSGCSPLAGSGECSKKFTSSIKGKRFYDWLSRYQLLKQYPVVWKLIGWLYEEQLWLLV